VRSLGQLARCRGDTKRVMAGMGLFSREGNERQAPHRGKPRDILADSARRFDISTGES
jgi:hypothetical protein